MKQTFLFSLIVFVSAFLCGCSSSPRHINDIPDAQVSYKITDKITGEEYQVASVKTIPNTEYEIKSASGETRKIVDNVPITLSGLTDMDGNIIVPLEFNHVYEIINGYILVQMHSRPEHYHYSGVYYKDGSVVIPSEYHSLKMDPEGKGAIATISNPDGRTQQIYAFDFKNGNKKTLLPFNTLSCSISDGKIHVREHNKETRLYEDRWFDFSGNEISE